MSAITTPGARVSLRSRRSCADSFQAGLGVNGDNLVAVTHDFETPEAASAFLSDEELKGVMQRAGVDAGSIQVHLLERD